MNGARELARAIRAKCLECSGGMRGEVRGCRIRSCALWPYRCAGAENAGGIRVGTNRGPADGGGREGVMAGQMGIYELYREA